MFKFKPGDILVRPEDKSRLIPPLFTILRCNNKDSTYTLYCSRSDITIGYVEATYIKETVEVSLVLFRDDEELEDLYV